MDLEQIKKKPLVSLTVGEFINLQNNFQQSKKSPNTSHSEEIDYSKQYVFGYEGLAKLYGCSRSKIYSLKKSGILDPCIKQNGRKIMFHKKKALECFTSEK